MISLKTKNWQIDDIKTVLLDKDGTFIDLHYFWGKMTELRVKEIIKRFNLEAGNFRKLCLHLGYDINTGKMLSNGITALYSRSKIIEIFRGNLEEFDVFTTDEELAEIFDYVSEIFYQDMVKYTKPIESAVEFIKVLSQKGVKLGVVTSDSVVSTELTLKNFGWEDLFEVVVGRETSNETKESGALTKIALEKLGANPQATIMIGDAPMDYISAKNAGIENTILVATGQIRAEELQQTSSFVVGSLSEIEIV
ncbi:HAD family hydrolase [bacterium]|nr:HAD family hydrolase [bacterium]